MWAHFIHVYRTQIRGYPILLLIGANVLILLLIRSVKFINPETYEKVQEVAPKMEELKEVVIPPEILKYSKEQISLCVIIGWWTF